MLKTPSRLIMLTIHWINMGKKIISFDPERKCAICAQAVSNHSGRCTYHCSQAVTNHSGRCTSPIVLKELLINVAEVYQFIICLPTDTVADVLYHLFSNIY